MSMLHAIVMLEERPDDLEAVIDTSVMSPGMGAFIAILLLAASVFALLVSMVRRLRRVRYREEAREKIAAELAERGEDAGQDPVQDPGPDAEK